MKDHILKFILAISLLLNVSLLATASYIYYKQSTIQPSSMEPVLRQDGFLFDALSLRPDQVKKMQQKALSFHAEIDKKRQEIIEKRLMFIDLVRQDKPDKGAIDATISEINRMQMDMQKIVAAHILEVKADLDKNQQEKFLSLLQDAMIKRARTPWF